MHKARAADENEVDRVVELKGSKNPQDKDNEQSVDQQAIKERTCTLF